MCVWEKSNFSSQPPQAPFSDLWGQPVNVESNDACEVDIPNHTRKVSTKPHTQLAFNRFWCRWEAVGAHPDLPCLCRCCPPGHYFEFLEVCRRVFRSKNKMLTPEGSSARGGMQGKSLRLRWNGKKNLVTLSGRILKSTGKENGKQTPGPRLLRWEPWKTKRS